MEEFTIPEDGAGKYAAPALVEAIGDPWPVLSAARVRNGSANKQNAAIRKRLYRIKKLFMAWVSVQVKGIFKITLSI